MRRSTKVFLSGLAMLYGAIGLAQAAFAQSAGATPSMATLTSPGDASLTFLAQIFGSAMFANPGNMNLLGMASAAVPVQTAIGAYMSVLNTLVFVIGGSFFIYQILQMIVQASHTGQVLSDKISVMAPARFLIAIAALAPVNNGFSAMQSVTAEVIVISVNAGSWAWSSVMSQVVTGLPISNSSTSDLTPLARSILEMEICRHESNMIVAGQKNMSASWPADFAMGPYVLTQPTPSSAPIPGADAPAFGSSGGSDPASYYHWAPGAAASGGGDTTYTPNSCGSVDWSWAGKSSWGPLRDAHVAATTALFNLLDPIAQRIVAGTSDNVPAADLANLPAAGDIAAAISQADTLHRQKINAAVSGIASSSATSSQMISAMKAGGWMWAGTWWNRIAEINGDLSAQASVLPSSVMGNNSFRNNGADLTIYNRAMKVTNELFDRQNIPTAAAWKPSPGSIWGDAITGQAPDAKSQDADSPGVLSKVWSFVSGVGGLTTVLQGALSGSFLSSPSILGSLINANNPVSSLAAWGQGIATTATSVELAISLPGAALGPFGSAFFESPTGHLIGFALAALHWGAYFIGYVLPMVPYAIWIAAVIGYFILAIEAMVAAPLWAFAHLRAGGEGIHGEASAGYMIILNLLLRPTLMVGGYIAAMAMSSIVAQLIIMTYGAAVADSAPQLVSTTTNGVNLPAMTTALTGGIFTVINALIGLIIKFIVFGALMTISVERCFSLINKLPDTVIRWLGGSEDPIGRENEQHGSQIRGGAVMISQGSRGGGHAIEQGRNKAAANRQSRAAGSQLSDSRNQSAAFPTAASGPSDNPGEGSDGGSRQ